MEKKEIRILTVDDEDSVLDFLKEVVESQGYVFLSARNGEDALNSIDKTRPDLVLLDIEMPKLNGLEVLRRIREKDKALPVVILTAYSTGERVKEAIKLDISGYIPKEAPLKETISTIKTVLKISLK